MPTPTRSDQTPDPDVDTLQGETPDYGAAGNAGYPIQVVVKGTVYTQEQPAGNSADGSVNVTVAETQPLFNVDPRRKELVIWCENNSIFFGTNKSRVQNGASAHLPAGGSATIRHKDAIWVRGDSGTALVSYIVELYGD